MDDPQWPRAAAWLDGQHRAGADAPLLAVLGAPLSAGSISPSAAHLTPPAIRRALRRFSTLAVLPDGQTVDIADVRAVDLGDLALDDLANEDAQAVIAGAVAEVVASPELDRPPDLLVILGGHNGVTRPAMAAAAAPLDTAGLLTLDAHHDVRALDDGPTNGTPVRGLIDEGLRGANIVQVGIAAFTNSAAYRAYCDAKGITVVGVDAARAAGVGVTVRRHLDTLAARCAQLYVDLDVDVLDAAFAPGCPGARPGGFTPGELHSAAFEAGRHAAVATLDIVEVDADADAAGTTVDNAALCLLWAAAGLAVRRRQTSLATAD